METTIAREIQNLQLKSDHMENYKDIELTEEEIQAALLQAKKEKVRRQKEAEYWQRVKSPKKYLTTTAEELINMVKLHPDLIINEENQAIIMQLAYYFSQDPRMSEFDIDPNKGIILAGPTGCGKTTLMKLYQNNMHQSYSVVSCRKVGYDFAEKGFKAIEAYSANYKTLENPFGHKEYGMCFDDLGTDEERRRYGDKVNAMEEILLGRYDNVPFRFTHITTNLTVEQMGDIYGPRVRSRMSEMFNLISFNPTAKDWRRK